MNKFLWYDIDKRECSCCGTLMPNDEVVLAIHEKEAYHKIKLATQPYEVKEIPIEDYRKVFKTVFGDLMHSINAIEELDIKNQKLREML
jgi:hypothetical protein